MKKTLLTTLAAAAMLLGLSTAAHAQILYTTNFGSGYTAGNLAGQNGWSAISGAGTNPIQVGGGAATIQSVAGEDDTVTFATPFTGTGTTSTVTASFGNLTVTTAGTAGSYFLALAGGAASTNYTGRVFARSTTGGFQLGIIPSSTGTPVYGTTVLTLGTAYNLAINFGFNSGTGDDTLSLSVNGANYATYGTAFDFGATGGGSATLGSLLFRQDSATSTGATVGSINVTASVPEPATYAYVAAGAGMLALVVRRRRVA